MPDPRTATAITHRPAGLPSARPGGSGRMPTIIARSGDLHRAWGALAAVRSGMLRRMLLGGLAAIVLVACDSGGDDSSTPTTIPLFDTTSTSFLPTTPVVGRALSP